ncbi:hypothetical protein COOONC_13423 [Cooperia oncophora]
MAWAALAGIDDLEVRGGPPALAGDRVDLESNFAKLSLEKKMMRGRATMVPRSQTGWLGPLAFCLLIAGIEAISKNFVNSSMPEMRPTFVVNFDMATVICQHSAESTDLHLHEISVLCDGKNDCYQNPAMHDESFPYCGRSDTLLSLKDLTD